VNRLAKEAKTAGKKRNFNEKALNPGGNERKDDSKKIKLKGLAEQWLGDPESNSMDPEIRVRTKAVGGGIFPCLEALIVE
jgi:hypothetical protein